jgi:hypothetical protein
MKIPKYIQNKIKQQNEACKKASKLEVEIEIWNSEWGGIRFTESK